MSATFQPPVKLHPGTQRTILDVSPTAASTHTVWFENQADSILLTLFVNSSAGDVNVSLYSVTQGGSGRNSCPRTANSLLPYGQRSDNDTPSGSGLSHNS